METTLSTMAQAMYSIIRYTDRSDLTLVDVMGFTTHAFRIRIDADKVDTGGPVAHVWEPFYRNGLQNLGFSSICYDPIIFPVPLEHIEHALTLIQATIDRGIPAISFALHSAEFNVIFGYDDERRELHLKDQCGVVCVPYEKLGEGKILVICIEQVVGFDRLTALKSALGMALFHSHHQEPGLHQYKNGFAAYDAWIHAFKEGTIDEIGNAYNLAFVGDARRVAVRFLLDFVEKWPSDHPRNHEQLHGSTPLKSFICELLEKTAEHYSEVVRCFELLQGMFPFPNGGNPRDTAQAAKAVHYLEQSKAAEEKAIHLLGRVYYWL